ncbi:MAG: hypothetical protein ABII76_08105, partial [Pseudomonadota bacterium]
TNSCPGSGNAAPKNLLPRRPPEPAVIIAARCHARTRQSSGTQRMLTAKALVDEMTTVVAHEWYATARACGVSEADCEAIHRAYVYPGFSLKAQPGGQAAL